MYNILKIIFIIILFMILFNNINFNVKEYFTLDGNNTCDPIISEIYPDSKQCPDGYRCPSQNETNCSGLTCNCIPLNSTKLGDQNPPTIQCNPNTDPPQMCPPGNIACPQCGLDTCPCPDPNVLPHNTTPGIPMGPTITTPGNTLPNMSILPTPNNTTPGIPMGPTITTPGNTLPNMSILPTPNNTTKHPPTCPQYPNIPFCSKQQCGNPSCKGSSNKFQQIKSGQSILACYPDCLTLNSNIINNVCDRSSCKGNSGGGSGGNCKDKPGESITTIQGIKLNSDSVHINNQSVDYLHVFICTTPWKTKNPDNKLTWNKIGGNGIIGPAIWWGHDQGTTAFAALGSQYSQEVIIKPNDYITLSIPKELNDPTNDQFQLKPLRMNKVVGRSWDTFLKPSESNSTIVNKYVKSKVDTSILIEAGRDAVGDVSAADGLNYLINYKLTTCKKPLQASIKNVPLSCKKNGKILEDCVNPQKLKPPEGCGNSASVTCGGDQICGFNSCSQTLFEIPPTSDPSHKYWKSGSQFPWQPDGGNVDNKPVKSYVEKSSNLKKKGLLSDYCSAIHADSEDFTAYCYDYNDEGSSPYFRAPYQIEVTYKDLQ